MDGTVKKFKKGAPILAQHLHVPIVPVAVKGILRDLAAQSRLELAPDAAVERPPHLASSLANRCCLPKRRELRSERRRDCASASRRCGRRCHRRSLNWRRSRSSAPGRFGPVLLPATAASHGSATAVIANGVSLATRGSLVAEPEAEAERGGGGGEDRCSG